ncbi:MAG: hypothetical protein LLF94_11075, partial [Chlamydiales bacterium]|nr:hypothetical protein [Chlamydiales bacterium]
KLPEFMTLLVSNYSIHEDAKAVLEEKLFAIAAQKSDVNSRGDFVSNLVEMIQLLKDPSTDDKEAKAEKFVSLLGKLQLADEFIHSIFIPSKWD